MAFDIYGTKTHLADDSCDYKMMEFASNLNEHFPIINKLLYRFYDDTELNIKEISALKCELEFVKNKYQEKVTPIILRKKKISAKNKNVYDNIVNNLL
ncbi:hypothetical protein QUF70_21490, partial [Desulfobacterales bacterium HSG17]|nr:hypothetical protein [Desulfobacterales bacterium HSG17]